MVSLPSTFNILGVGFPWRLPRFEAVPGRKKGAERGGGEAVVRTEESGDREGA